MISARASCRVGADIGGTFTDLVLIGADGRIALKKVPSTVHDYAQGILLAIEQALADEGGGAEQIDEVVHGTTVATNAVLEHKGARTGLITTAGFRDVLEIRRLRMPKLYLLDWQKPPVLVERWLRLEVGERIAADGTVRRPLDPAEVEAAGRRLVEEGAQAIAVTFLNSYVNPAHEILAGEVLRRAFPDIPVSLSVEILPEIQEYERTSTTVVNAYVQPMVRGYIESLQRSLHRGGVAAPLLIMQSNGGTMSGRGACASPVRIIESGPAAGVIACQQLARRAGYPNVISFDMGGTTAKASLIEDGNVTQATEYEVGGGLSGGSRLSRGGGYVIRVPSIDIAEVGAGGGSLVGFDKAGGIQVGPESAGADPGPVCYGAGNERPTTTDANLVLGYLNPEAIAGGSVPLDAAAARRAIEEHVAKRLGSAVEEAALGIHRIANATMIRALRQVTIERGRDPSEFVLCAFGGSGPLHAAQLARAMDIGTVLVPPCPGLFSAFGLLVAQVEHHHSRTIKRPLKALSADDLGGILAQMEEAAHRGARDPEYPLHDYRLVRALDLQYVGQASALQVRVPDGPVTGATLGALEAAFYEEYQRTYGFHSAGETIEVVNARVVAQTPQPESAGWFEAAARSGAGAARHAPAREAYFGPEHGVLETPVLARLDLADAPRRGPLIVEEYDATTVVPPGCRAALDALGNIVITVGLEARP